ncbi:MAG: BatA and WFA domain-containing protein [Vicinamibacterales bacterium]
MSFLTPLYLVGAALIALPIMLHLLRRDVAPPVPFTAVSLLPRSPVDRSRQRRLRDLLLLAARVLALLLLAASFARPYLAGTAPSGRTTVVALDRSFSMADPTRFGRALALAREAIDAAQGDRVALVAFDDGAEVLAAPGAPADARAALAALQPGAGATRYAALFDKAAELLVDEAHGRVVVVSDLQRSGFDDSGAVLPEGIDLQVRDAGAAANNLALTSVAIDRRQVIATVRNFGARTRIADVRVIADGRKLPLQRATIAGGDAVDVSFDAPAAGARRVEARVDDADGYAADNDRYALAEARTLPRVLIVGGAAPASNGFYLSRALLAGAEDGADFDVRIITGAAFMAEPAERLREQSVVMILSTHGLGRRAADPVRGFLAQGGGVLIAAGPDVDAAVVSTLLGWEPALAAREVRRAGVLAATDLRHPVLRPFDAVAANFGQVIVDRAWDLPAGGAWRVVARYTNGGTALAERTGMPTGRVMVFTSDLDRRWNEFPLNAAFVPFTQELARYLGGRSTVRSAYLVADVPAGVPARPGLVTVANRTVAVNVDPRESSVARVSAAEFQQMVTRSSGQSQPRAVRLAQQAEGQQNYWRYGLLLMLGALVVEAVAGSR